MSSKCVLCGAPLSAPNAWTQALPALVAEYDATMQKAATLEIERNKARRELCMAVNYPGLKAGACN